MTLARLSRAGKLTSVWVPDEAHEAMRDLIRAREAATKDVRQIRQRIQSFVLRHGRRYPGAVWKKKHRVWLANQSFAHPAQQIAFQIYLNAMDQALERKELIDKQIKAAPLSFATITRARDRKAVIFKPTGWRGRCGRCGRARLSVFSGAEWLGIFGVTAALYREITLEGGKITAFRRVSLQAGARRTGSRHASKAPARCACHLAQKWADYRVSLRLECYFKF